jgi:hypothetical protein
MITVKEVVTKSELTDYIKSHSHYIIISIVPPLLQMSWKPLINQNPVLKMPKFILHRIQKQ